MEFVTRYLIPLTICTLCSYAVYKEQELIKFERKAIKYIKAFLKSIYYSFKDKHCKRKCKNCYNFYICNTFSKGQLEDDKNNRAYDCKGFDWR